MLMVTTMTEIKITLYKTNLFKAFGSVAFTTFTILCGHPRLQLALEYCHHPKENFVPTKKQSRPTPLPLISGNCPPAPHLHGFACSARFT